MQGGGDKEAGVEDLVEHELLGAGSDGERGGAEIEKAEDVGGERKAGEKDEERDEPSDVPRIVGGKEEHQGPGKGETGEKEGRVGSRFDRGSVDLLQLGARSGALR